jgi:hypothetical protein
VHALTQGFLDVRAKVAASLIVRLLARCEVIGVPHVERAVGATKNVDEWHDVSPSTRLARSGHSTCQCRDLACHERGLKRGVVRLR